jgi:hypothetical protein
MANLSTVAWADQARDEVKVRADLEGGREGVIWALEQLVAKLRTRQSPPRAPERPR